MSRIDRREFLTLLVTAAAAVPTFALAAGKSAGSPLEVTYYYLPG